MERFNLEYFNQVVAQDQELQEKLKAAIDPETFVKLVVDLGKEKGYSFTTQEVEKTIIEAEEKKDTEALWQELNERELEVVAGGPPGVRKSKRVQMIYWKRKGSIGPFSWGVANDPTYIFQSCA
jgi:predicted ribosomally synthesized peptide with nif11-like leader